MALSNSNSQSNPLADLLQLESSLFKSTRVEELAFLLVNQLKQLIVFEHASFWVERSGKLVVTQTTGVTTPDAHAPYLQWLSKVINQSLSRKTVDGATSVVAEELPRKLSSGWRENVKGAVLFIPLKDQHGRLLGGLWITRSVAWSDQEKMVINRLMEAATVVLVSLWQRNQWRNRIRGWIGYQPLRKITFLLLFSALFVVPVRQSALAPAEIVASAPVTVTAPMDGVIDEVLIEPNQRVLKGDLLFTLDRRGLEKQQRIEQEAVDIAQAELLSASQKIFGGSTGEDLEPLRFKILQSKERVNWILQQLEKSRIEAPIGGVVIDAETRSWRGRPVRTGERTITLANPAQMEVEMWLPVEDLLPLSESTEVDLFLYSRGNQRTAAYYQRIAYQAERSPQGTLAYRVTAVLGEEDRSFRIGERGTAKLYGEETTLFFYLLRKPILWLRQWTG